MEKKLIKGDCYAEKNLLFHQDDALGHNSKVAQKYCCDKFINFIPFTLWPGNNPNLNLERLNTVNVSKAFNSTYITVFMLIAVVLGFMLLDMYLQRKRQQPTT